MSIFQGGQSVSADSEVWLDAVCEFYNGCTCSEYSDDVSITTQIIKWNLTNYVSEVKYYLEQLIMFYSYNNVLTYSG